MYQQNYVLNTTNQLESQANRIADEEYIQGMNAIRQQEQYLYENSDLVYRNAYENSLYEDELYIEDGEFISNALDFDRMTGGSYFLNKLKNKNKKLS
jgi:hypothetical protein